MPKVTRVPKAPAHFRGVINLHGNVVPVLDIARRFGIGETRLDDDARVVVVESGDQVVGILAESVSKVTRFARTDVQPPPPLASGVSAEFIDGIVRAAGRFLVFLNLERVLDDGAIDEADHADGE